MTDKMLRDGFGREITYLRLSVTDRCDLRCAYCMAEQMTFLPRADLLTLEELDRVAYAFIARGVRKIRLTGGEPLVRRGIMDLVSALGARLGHGLDELTLTTNATQLPRYAEDLARAGVRRVNVSLDTLQADRFAEITRRNTFSDVMAGIDAAKSAGLHIKINTVVLKHQNAHDIADMVAWAHSQGFDMTLIEVMPLGDTGEDRIDQYVPLPMIRDQLEARWTLHDMPRTDKVGGPSAYVRIAETGGRLGFITPLTNNFCAGCNRVRLTCTGRIYMCLGQDDHVDLREIMRTGEGDVDERLHRALDAAMLGKPEKHTFDISRRGVAPTIARHMSLTGG